MTLLTCRFSDQSEWFRPNSRGKFSYDFLNTPDSTIEEIDLSGTLINHDGLDNISKAHRCDHCTHFGLATVQSALSSSNGSQSAPSSSNENQSALSKRKDTEPNWSECCG